MSEYRGYGSHVIMDKVAECTTIDEQVAIIKEAMKDQDLAARLGRNQRFAKWLADNKDVLVARYAP